MKRITPRILIEGREVDYLKGSYTCKGNFTSAILNFTLPLQYGGRKKLWNKEVTFFLNEFDSTPIFRGWIKRTKPTFNDIEIRAEDALGYMLRGGEASLAKIVLTDKDNLDGLTTSAAVVKALQMAKLDTKLKTDMIGNTTPEVGSTDKPLRGNVKVLDVIKDFLSRATLTVKHGTTNAPNIAKIIDDGTNSQLVFEQQKRLDVETSQLQHIYSEGDNIINLSIINRKVPTIITVTGKNGVRGTFSHTSALAAYDRNYLEVANELMKSPAECKAFAAKLFEMNLEYQYEYGLETFEGAYLSENDLIMIQTDDPEFSGKYRVVGKNISFSPSSFALTLSIQNRPPVLAEYIASLDN